VKDPQLEETEKDFDLSSLTEKLSEDKLPENLDDGDDWLDNLVVKQSDEEAIGKIEELSIGESEENIPDWIQSVIEAEPEKIEELETGTVDPTISMEEVPMEPKDEFTISFDESDDIPEQPEISDTDNMVDLEKVFDGSDEVLEQQTTNLEKTTSDQAISIDGTSDELEELFAKQSLSQLEEELLATNKEISGLREDFEFSDVESESEEPVSADEKEDIESTLAWMEGMLSTQTSHSKEIEGIETEPVESAEAQPQWISDLSQESLNEPGEMDTIPSWLKELEIEAESFTEKSLDLESITDEEALIESNVDDHLSKDTLFEEIEESPEQVKLEKVETETFREGEMEPELVSSTEKLEGDFEETSPEIRQVAEPEDVVSEISEEFSTDIDQISIKTESLEEAKRLLDSGAVDQSIQKFDELIKDNLFLEEIISNVQNALDHHYPINIELWKTLGDAHLKNKQLQKALDAYSKAEDLLS
jgi:tetratricopeptide (TPR) repeat protein